MRKKFKSILSGILSAVLIFGTGGTAAASGTQQAMPRAAGGNIVVDYNTSIGSGTPESVSYTHLLQRHHVYFFRRSFMQEKYQELLIVGISAAKPYGLPFF